MRHFLPLILSVVFITLFSTEIKAQNNHDTIHRTPNQITISSSGEAMVPADFAVLSINISETHEQPQKAFELHKERESFLANLLSELDLPDDKINYQPISIRPNRQRDGNVQTSTSQSVQFELDDFEQLSEIQLELISNGFDNFSGNLASTKMEEAASIALEQAIKNARSDAEVLAREAGKILGSVQSIHHSADGVHRPAVVAEGMQVRSMDSGPSLGDFSQSITVQKRIEIRFELLDQDEE